MSRSTASVTDRLAEHLRRLVDDIKREMNSGLYSGSPEAVAESRERFLSEVLSRFLPRSFDLAKGKIYDAHGGISDSIDIVILGNNHPKFRNSSGQIELLLADGVHAAIELKPVLTDLPALDSPRAQAPEIWRALEQVRTVKRLLRLKAPLLTRTPAPDFHDYARRIPAYVVTAKAPPVADLGAYVDSYYAKHRVPVEEQLDALIILDHGILVNVKHKGHFLRPLDDNGVEQLVMLAYETENSLVELLYLLMTEVSSEPQISEPFLPKYLRGLLRSTHKASFTCKE